MGKRASAYISQDQLLRVLQDAQGLGVEFRLAVIRDNLPCQGLVPGRITERLSVVLDSEDASVEPSTQGVLTLP